MVQTLIWRPRISGYAECGRVSVSYLAIADSRISGLKIPNPQDVRCSKTPERQDRNIVEPEPTNCEVAKSRNCESANPDIADRIPSSNLQVYETQDSNIWQSGLRQVRPLTSPAFGRSSICQTQHSAIRPFDQLSIWPFGCSVIQPVRPSTGRAFGGSGLQAVGHSDNWTFQRSGV